MRAGAATVQTHRNLGKAYYEQGKYAEAIEEFQKVSAGGRALATDHLDLGMALMQANKLDEALGELTTARQMDSKLTAADYNLGILYKRELRYPDAETALKRVTEADPNDPAAWFNLGTVYFAQKKWDESLAAFKRVDQMGFGRGQNFYVASLFRMFTALVRLGRQPEAQAYLKLHEKFRDTVPTLSLQNPALEGGRYGAILVPISPPRVSAQRTSAPGVKFDDISQQMRIYRPGNAPPDKQAARDIKAADYSLEFARSKLVPLFGPSIVAGDYDGDGLTDLFFVDPAGTNRLFHANADGTYTDVTEKAGVAGTGGALSAVLADYTNSGNPSLFVAGLGGVTLFRNEGDGTFVDETAKAGLRGAADELATRAVLFDADNDGFLDLFVAAYTRLGTPPPKDRFNFPDDFSGIASHFYRNNGDGTFTEMSGPVLDAAKGRARGAVFADFNNDGYTDLVIARDDGPPVLLANLGEGKFADRTREAGAAFAAAEPSTDAQVADFDHDGSFDLALWTRSGPKVLLNRGNGKFVEAKNLPAIAPPAGLFDFRGTVADLDGDGYDDLLAIDSDGKWHDLANRGGRFEEAPLTLSAAASAATAGERSPTSFLTTAWLRNPANLDVLAVRRTGEFLAYRRSGPPARWIEVKLNGSKSNAQGVGTVVELKAGNYYRKVVATGGPVRVFTGGVTRLDVVRVTWPNAIVQNSINVATNKPAEAGKPIEVRESERLASSCPFLYVWDGRRFVFLTDVLGVAPLGELNPDGTRVKPNPEELVRLPRLLSDRPAAPSPAESLQPGLPGFRAAGRDGLLTFQLTDELREVDFFDRVRLLAMDHPSSEEIFANEIYSSSPMPPSLYAVRDRRPPVSAADDNGRDVLPLILEADGLAPTDFPRHRILGLSDPHSLTLDLGDFPAESRGPTPEGGSGARGAALWLTGWVFWTDSNASRALRTNSALQMVPPYLQVRNAQGEWVTAIADMGLPSGTNRTMRVDLTGKFPTRDHHVRIVTNLCVYWDRAFVSFDDRRIPVGAACDSPRAASSTTDPCVAELPLVSADLHYRGFSTPSTDPEHLRPDTFDYERVMADAPWNSATGNYTRYGPVEKLLERADDRLVAMATGDELTVTFSARELPPPSPGWQRDFFLYLTGYAKDGEPNTAFAKTVTPLPFRSMSNYPPSPGDAAPSGTRFRRYLADYQTRPAHALIPPLAPAHP